MPKHFTNIIYVLVFDWDTSLPREAFPWSRIAFLLKQFTPMTATYILPKNELGLHMLSTYKLASYV